MELNVMVVGGIALVLLLVIFIAIKMLKGFIKLVVIIVALLVGGFVAAIKMELLPEEVQAKFKTEEQRLKDQANKKVKELKSSTNKKLEEGKAKLKKEIKEEIKEEIDKE